MARKTTSLKVDEEVWKKAKIHCILNNKDLSEFIESLLIKELKLKKEDK